MNHFVLPTLFALFWIGLTGAFTLPNALLGVFLGTVSLYIFREQMPAPANRYSFKGILALSGLFVFELIKSAISVSILVLRPDMKLKYGIFAYETKLTNDSNITLLSNLITLTPGTLTLDISADRRVLLIHAIDCSDVEATKAGIRDGFERKIIEAFGNDV